VRNFRPACPCDSPRAQRDATFSPQRGCTSTGARQMHRSLDQFPNRQGLSMFGVARQQSGFRPVESPRIFDSDHCVRARNYIRQRELPSKIALISSKHILVLFRIFRHKNYHHS